VIIGSSAGGVRALQKFLSLLKPGIGLSLVLVIHRLKNVQSDMAKLFQASSSLPVREVEDKMKIEKGTVYLAPANYHLLIERDSRFSLSSDEEIFFSRPSIDATLYSLAEACPKSGIGIILTGANEDGARGLRQLEKSGGTVIVQDSEEAEISVMPDSARAFTNNTKVMTLAEIARYLNQL